MDPDFVVDSIRSHECGAYFCRFDDETRTFGAETLVLGSETVSMEEGNRDFIERSVNSILSINPEFSGSIPIFISYDYVSEVFSGISVKRSSWPMAVTFVPESVSHGTIERQKQVLPELPDSIMLPVSLGEAIRSVRDRIRSGELLQCVLSQQFPVGSIDRVATLRRYLLGDGSAYVFYFKFGNRELIGTSPENLVSMQGLTLRMKPIAGTRNRGRSEEEDRILEDTLRYDSKELLEHRMLVDLARNDIGKVSVPGSVHVTRSMEVQKFSTVQHLVSTVESARDARYTRDDILRAVFPAGTVTGAPKKRAVQTIDLYEDTARGPYAGCVGMAGKDSMDLALTIRTLFSSGNEFFARAGAGIVKDSVEENEIREIVAKARSAAGVAV